MAGKFGVPPMTFLGDTRAPAVRGCARVRPTMAGMPTNPLTDAHNRWLHQLDARLGPVAPLSPDGETCVVDEPGLLAVRRRVEVPADASYALFVPPVQELLVVRSASALDHEGWGGVVDAWLPHTDDGTPMVRCPARDEAASSALRDRGFEPVTTTSLRLLDGHEPDPAHASRTATAADRERLLDLLEVMHGSNVAAGGATALPDERSLLAHYLDEALEDEGTRCWVVDGPEGVVGMLSASTPEASEWAAPSTSLHPVSYLGLASVAPEARGQGIARALTATALQWAGERGAQAMLLDHASQSPSARGTWASLGFVPLWHTWHRATA